MRIYPWGKHRSRNKWRKLPACDAMISRKLEAYATVPGPPPLAFGSREFCPTSLDNLLVSQYDSGRRYWFTSRSDLCRTNLCLPIANWRP